MVAPFHPPEGRGVRFMRLGGALLTAAALWQAVAAAPPAPGPAPAPTREVLPDAVVPSHYALVLSPDAEKLLFHGSVSITVDVRAEVPPKIDRWIAAHDAGP